MNEKQNVVILFGGHSSEHEISCISAASILNHIDRGKYCVRTVGITKSGRWLLTEAEPGQIEDGSWERKQGNRRVLVSLDTDRPGLWAECGKSLEEIPVQVVFPVLHGKNGEDGTVQGLLQTAGIPYVGSDCESSAVCMDKAVTKAMVSQAEAALQARCCIIYRNGCDPEEAAEGADAFFKGKYPLFVKPARAGSSVGISKVKGGDQLAEAIRRAFAEDSKILVEEAIEGRELEVAVLGNGDPAVAPCVGEIFSAGEFYDYEAKYANPDSRTDMVKDLSPDTVRQIRDTALGIYRIMECRGLARVDFFLAGDGRVIFNELNTMPGFTRISMYPGMWEASGLSYADLIDTLIGLAVNEE